MDEGRMMDNELKSNVTEEQRRAIQAFVHSAITPLIEEVIVKKLGQAAIVLRDELSDENTRAAVEQAGGGGNVGPEPPSDMVWPPDRAVWLAPIETNPPANPKLLQYAWARSNLSSGQMAEAYQCIVSAAQDCGQEYRLPLATPPAASAGVTEAKLAKLVEAAQGFELIEHADGTWLMFRSSVEKGLGSGSVRLDGPMAKDARARFALLRAALSAAKDST
jgi:hypothetical protein